MFHLKNSARKELMILNLYRGSLVMQYIQLPWFAKTGKLPCYQEMTTLCDHVRNALFMIDITLYKSNGHHAHYGDVMMIAIASQITSLTIAYSAVYSGRDQRKIKAPRHWPLWGEFTGDRTKGQQRGKWFHLMTSSCDEALVPRRCDCKLKLVIFKIICRIDISSTFSEISLKWMTQNTSGDTQDWFSSLISP